MFSQREFPALPPTPFLKELFSLLSCPMSAGVSMLGAQPGRLKCTGADCGPDDLPGSSCAVGCWGGVGRGSGVFGNQIPVAVKTKPIPPSKLCNLRPCHLRVDNS